MQEEALDLDVDARQRASRGHAADEAGEGPRARRFHGRYGRRVGGCGGKLDEVASGAQAVDVRHRLSPLGR